MKQKDGLSMLKHNNSFPTNRKIQGEIKYILQYNYFWITVYSYPFITGNKC